jgi:hypothetical protein
MSSSMKPHSGPAMTAPPRDNVGVGPPAGQLSDLDVAEAGDQERKIGALPVREAGEDLERLARLQDVVDRKRVGDHCVPGACRQNRLEVKVTAIAPAQPEGFARGDDVEPAEDRCPVGLSAEHDRPGVLAGVFDELARGVHSVGDGSL